MCEHTNVKDSELEDYYGLLKKYLTWRTLLYIKTAKPVRGYLGHENRTRETDHAICHFLDKNPHLIKEVNNAFLTGSDGWNFMYICNGYKHLMNMLNHEYLDL